MTKYYKKLMSRTKLLNFWVFSGNDIKTVFHNNYKLLNVVYNQKAILDFDSLILGIKKVLPIFKYLCGTLANILFVSSNSIYTQTVRTNNTSNLGKQLTEWKVGVLSNFSLQGFRLFKHLKLNVPPEAIVFLSFQDNDLLLLESKKKNLPTIGLIDDNFNSYLMDYPINLSPLYFYNVYFFSKFFFRYLTVSI
jgi:ribosomal protein S2